MSSADQVVNLRAKTGSDLGQVGPTRLVSSAHVAGERLLGDAEMAGKLRNRGSAPKRLFPLEKLLVKPIGCFHGLFIPSN
jgi:hypothetical protein